VADLDAAIRAALDNTEHGDRPDGGMCHADCCGDGYVCECGLNEKPRAALRAVLDEVEAWLHTDIEIRQAAAGHMVKLAIARALGIERDASRQAGKP
jgi:hypothetical protein